MELASESIPVPQVQELIVDTVKRNKSGVSRGKPRLRKKALHASILKQMEFYFSDANLSKDRYLSGFLKENSCEYSFLVSKIKFIVFVMYVIALYNSSFLVYLKDIKIY